MDEVRSHFWLIIECLHRHMQVVDIYVGRKLYWSKTSKFLADTLAGLIADMKSNHQPGRDDFEDLRVLEWTLKASKTLEILRGTFEFEDTKKDCAVQTVKAVTVQLSAQTESPSVAELSTQTDGAKGFWAKKRIDFSTQTVIPGAESAGVQCGPSVSGLFEDKATMTVHESGRSGFEGSCHHGHSSSAGNCCWTRRRVRIRPCVFCGERHFNSLCKNVPTYEGRLEKLGLDRCVGCFRRGHKIGDCEAKKRCYYCKEYGHNQALCSSRIVDGPNRGFVQSGGEI